MTLLSKTFRQGAFAAIALIGSTGMMLAPAASAQAADDAAQARDFSGTWDFLSPDGNPGYSRDLFVIADDLPYTTDGQNLAADRSEALAAGRAFANPHLMCRPTGVQGMTAPKEGMLIVQTADRLAFIGQKDREVRRVFIGGTHPADLRPTYTGNSVAHWEGNTLVIDTIGYNGRGQLDEIGNPHSTQLHVVERLSKSADGMRLTNQVTITDPGYYTRPFTTTRNFRRTLGARVFDFDCGENPRSDDFANFTFQDDWFKPVCVLEVKDDVVADKVVCTPQPRAGGAGSSKSATPPKN